MSFFYDFSFLLTKNCIKSSIRVQVIKRYIFLLGVKSNDPLYIDYIQNVFKFTEIPAKRTQESIKCYGRAQKPQRRRNMKTSINFRAQDIFNDSKMELGRLNDKGTQIIKLSSLFL